MTTIVEAGPDVAEDLAVGRHRAFGVGGRGEERAGADDVAGGRAASASAASTISQQRRAWSAVDSGQPPSGITGPVPETSTRSPVRTARENPMTGS